MDRNVPGQPMISRPLGILGELLRNLIDPSAPLRIARNLNRPGHPLPGLPVVERTHHQRGPAGHHSPFAASLPPCDWRDRQDNARKNVADQHNRWGIRHSLPTRRTCRVNPCGRATAPVDGGLIAHQICIYPAISGHHNSPRVISVSIDSGA